MLPKAIRFPVVLSLIAAGLAASAALYIDYTAQDPVFCAEGGGCDALKYTLFAHPLGIPLPAIGILAFLVLGILALSRGPFVRKAFATVAGVGAFVGIFLIGIQAATRHFCPYCAVVDVSVSLVAALAIERMRSGWDPPKGPLASFVTSLTLAVAMAAPFVWAQHVTSLLPPEPPLPPVIAHELAEGPKGIVTIVDFVDFECPYCRIMQTRLEPVLLAQKDHIHLVRKMVPLTRIHPHALDAAKAYCCADAFGKGDAMADALFLSPVEDLVPEKCAKLAESLGVPADKYKECMGSPETDARLKKDRELFDQAAAKRDGLPLMWVGTKKLMGARDDATITSVIDDAIAHAGS